MIRAEDACDDPEQSRLAGAARSYEGDSLTRLHRERDVVEAPRGGSPTMQSRERWRDDVALTVEEEPNAELVRPYAAHSTIFANWRCSER